MHVKRSLADANSPIVSCLLLTDRHWTVFMAKRPKPIDMAGEGDYTGSYKGLPRLPVLPLPASPSATGLIQPLSMIAVRPAGARLVARRYILSMDSFETGRRMGDRPQTASPTAFSKAGNFATCQLVVQVRLLSILEVGAITPVQEVVLKSLLPHRFPQSLNALDSWAPSAGRERGERIC